MTPTDFMYWLGGVMHSGAPLPAMSAQVLEKAAEVLGRVGAVKAQPPAMRQLVVPAFCVHNVHVTEVCMACDRLGAQRLYGLRLPRNTRCVYIPVDAESSATAGNTASATSATGAATPIG